MLDSERVASSARSRRMALRDATREVHDRVEGIAENAGHFASLDGYRRYLTATWVLRSEFEASLDASGAARLWPLWPDRRVASLVETDMADLGMPKPTKPIRIINFDRPELLGVLYVLEGSGLGARVIIRNIVQLGLGCDFGARHLHAQAGSPEVWRDFTSLLDNAEMTEAEERACFAAAAQTFDAFATTFQSTRP